MGSPYRQFPFRKQPDNEAPADLIPDNGQVERMNQTIKGATVKRYHYESHDQLVRHLADFVAAYNFARRLKTLTGSPLRVRLQTIQIESAPPNAGTNT